MNVNGLIVLQQRALGWFVSAGAAPEFKLDVESGVALHGQRPLPFGCFGGTAVG